MDGSGLAPTWDVPEVRAAGGISAQRGAILPIPDPYNIMHKYPQNQSCVGSSGQTLTTNVYMTLCTWQIPQTHVLCGCIKFGTELKLGTKLIRSVRLLYTREIRGTMAQRARAGPLPRGIQTHPLCPKQATPPPPCVTCRRVVVSLRGPGQSPVRPFACCVGSLRSVGRCGRCSCWCRFRVRGAQSLVCRGCAGCGRMCRLRVSGAQ